jgi:spore coat polysaccharide biosynthesis protein SpsF
MKTAGFYVKAGMCSQSDKPQPCYGHIVRCIALADELKRRGFRCCFNTNEDGWRAVERLGFERTNGISEHDVWISDLPGGTSPQLAQGLCNKSRVLVILNGTGYPDGDPGRLLADLTIYQGRTNRPYELDWTGARGEWCEGPRHLILRREFHLWSAARELGMIPRLSDELPRVVIAGGGVDPYGVTEKAVDALAGSSLRLRVIVGPGNVTFASRDGIETIRTPRSMARALAWADIAVASYGMTALECLALGLPAVALSISSGHKTSADLVQDETDGALTSLGLVDDVSADSIRRIVMDLVEAQRRWNGLDLEGKARRYIDGRGTERVADLIEKKLQDGGRYNE